LPDDEPARQLPDDVGVRRLTPTYGIVRNCQLDGIDVERGSEKRSQRRI